MKITVGRLRSLVNEAQDDQDQEKETLIQVYSDVYKEQNGVRPRWMYDKLRAMSARDIEAEIEKLYDSPDDDDVEADAIEPIGLDEPTNAYEKMPMHLGMKRDQDTVGYEKRQGEFAGDAGRKHMKISRGR